jgi:hypothetical protein
MAQAPVEPPGHAEFVGGFRRLDVAREHHVALNQPRVRFKLLKLGAPDGVVAGYEIGKWAEVHGECPHRDILGQLFGANRLEEVRMPGNERRRRRRILQHFAGQCLAQRRAALGLRVELRALTMFCVWKRGARMLMIVRIEQPLPARQRLPLPDAQIDRNAPILP